MEKKTVREQQLEKLYRAGNFAAARLLASSIRKDDDAAESEKATATRLERAMASDPAVAVVFGVTLFAYVFIALHHLL